ncbi:MAG: hypothetical protein Q8P24_02515 [Desulfobacterales bacterium]|nr:hypothetical protein [Desulfobacterales bacterium]
MTFDQLHALHAKIGLLGEELMECEGVPEQVYDMLEEMNTMIYKEIKKKCPKNPIPEADISPGRNTILPPS